MPISTLSIIDCLNEIATPLLSYTVVRSQPTISNNCNLLIRLPPGFRRGWATYVSIYLFAKLSTLIIIAVIDPNNCLFRNAPRHIVPVVRQVLLLVAAVGFFIAQIVLAPFLDPVNNASEWTSRLNYVTTATTALLLNLDIPGKKIIDTYVLYT